jgi:hypothetical protein
MDSKIKEAEELVDNNMATKEEYDAKRNEIEELFSKVTVSTGQPPVDESSKTQTYEPTIDEVD